MQMQSWNMGAPNNELIQYWTRDSSELRWILRGRDYKIHIIGTTTTRVHHRWHVKCWRNWPAKKNNKTFKKKNIKTKKNYHLVIWHSHGKIHHAFKNGKPSISIRAIEKPWQTVSHNQAGYMAILAPWSQILGGYSTWQSVFWSWTLVRMDVS